MISESAQSEVETLAAPAPAYVAETEPLEAPQSPRNIEYEKLMYGRTRDVQNYLLTVAAFAVQFGDKGYIGAGLSAVGSNIYFSLRRAWTRSHDKDVVSVILAGYRAGVDENGEVMIGGPHGNNCAYDMRYAPLEEGMEGKILSWRRPETVETGLRMDQMAEQSTSDGSLLQFRLDLPKFWASFKESEVPFVEDTLEAREMALRVVHPQYRGPVLGCLKSPGGTVTAIEYNDNEHELTVGFDGTADKPDKAMALPACAVLNPHLKVGTTFRKGEAVADFLPRRAHHSGSNGRREEVHQGINRSWETLQRLYGVEVSEWLLREAVLLSDLRVKNRVLRKMELCPKGRQQSTQIIEDVRHLATKEGVPIVQVVRMPAPGSPRFSPLVDLRGPVRYDFSSLNTNWAHKFVE